MVQSIEFDCRSHAGKSFVALEEADPDEPQHVIALASNDDVL